MSGKPLPAREEQTARAEAAPCPETRSPKELREHREAWRFPRMTAAEETALEADVAEHGIQVPLDITPDGVVLDGRQRLGTALALGLESVPVRVVEPQDEIEFMYRALLVRRHLTAGQKALLVLGRDKYRAARAEGLRRRRANLRNSRLDAATLPHRGRSRAEIAARAGVGERTIQHAIKVLEHGDPTLEELVRTGGLSVEKAAREVTRRERYARIGGAKPLPVGVFDLIYADPAWRLGYASSDYAPEQYYPTMTVEEIAALRIPAADDCLLYLWVANPVLPDALKVMDAWGFRYCANEVWDKGSVGLGVWTHYQHELLLIGRKGNASPAPQELRCPSLFRAQRTRHSEKPGIVYERLERLYPHATRLELFARGKQRPGWTFWGNEASQ